MEIEVGTEFKKSHHSVWPPNPGKSSSASLPTIALGYALRAREKKINKSREPMVPLSQDPVYSIFASGRLIIGCRSWKVPLARDCVPCMWMKRIIYRWIATVNEEIGGFFWERGRGARGRLGVCQVKRGLEGIHLILDRVFYRGRSVRCEAFDGKQVALYFSRNDAHC